MISSVLTLSMTFALMTTFIVPVVVLMWLLVKKRAKSVLMLFAIGAMSFFAGHLALVVPLDFFIFSKEAFSDFSENYYYLAGLIRALDTTFAMLVAIIGFMYILKPGGINFNRCISYAVGFFGLYNIYNYGIKYISKITILDAINAGTLEENYPDAGKDTLDKMVEEITNDSPLYYVAEGLEHCFMIIVGLSIVFAIVYGMANKKIVPAALSSLGYLLVWNYARLLLGHYTHPIIALLVIIALTLPAVYVIKKISQRPKDVMIKPESMQMH